jgi:hypothetical protein
MPVFAYILANRIPPIEILRTWVVYCHMPRYRGGSIAGFDFFLPADI